MDGETKLLKALGKTSNENLCHLIHKVEAWEKKYY
jgi:hypothetical protein